MPNVLFINHPQKECGVHNYGVNVSNILKMGTSYSFIYLECSQAPEVLAVVQQYSPSHIVYNYHPSTLGWIRAMVPNIASRGIKQLAINHEPTLELPPGLTASISQDPSFVEHDNCYKTVRPIIQFAGTPYPQRTTISTFGFTFGNNDFVRAARTVNEQFDEALLRVNIPYAHFGDADGRSAREWDAKIRAVVTKPGIELLITHDFKTTPQLLDWLSESTLNIFAYQLSYGRGCSSTFDFALAVQKPVAITTSYQYKHFQSFLPEINFEHNALQSIIAKGAFPTDRLRDLWSNTNLRADYERILNAC